MRKSVIIFACIGLALALGIRIAHLTLGESGACSNPWFDHSPFSASELRRIGSFCPTGEVRLLFEHRARHRQLLHDRAAFAEDLPAHAQSAFRAHIDSHRLHIGILEAFARARGGMDAVARLNREYEQAFMYERRELQSYIVAHKYAP